METIVSTTTQHNKNKLTQINIDNSTEFKDLVIKIIDAETKEEIKSIDFMLCKEELRIGNIKLIGREIKLLKEFLNQNV